MRVDVVLPCACHGPGEFLGIEVRKHLFDAAEFGDCVDFVGAKGVD